jgi:hypothetical protein
MGKKNLDSIQIKDENILPDSSEETLLTKKRGRASKPASERDSEVVSIKITPIELATVREKAGELVPLGTFIKHYIRTQTDLFIKNDNND